MLAARAALVVPLLVGATGGTALGGGGKRAGVPTFEGAQEVVVRKQVMKVLKAHGCELAKSREMEIGVATQRAARVRRRFREGREGARAVGDRDGRDRQSARRSPFTTAATAPCWDRRRSRARTRARWRRRWRARSGASSAGKSSAAACRRARRRRRRSWRRPRTTTRARPTRMTRPSPEPSSPRVDSASEAHASADGDRDSESRRDKDSEADANVLEEEASAGPSPPGAVPPTFDAFIAPTGINRALVYHQDLSPAGMRPYGLPLAAAPALHVVWYPISALSSGPIQHLGIEAAIEQAFGLRSAAGTDGSALADRTFGNTVHDYAAACATGFRSARATRSGFRGPPANTRSCSRARATAATAGRCSTSPTPSTATAAPGSGCGWSCPPIYSLTLGGGYRYIFNAGGTHLDGYFPHRTVGGVDAELALGYRVTRSLEIAARASCAATSTTCIPRPATPSSWVGRSISTGPSASGWRCCWAAAVVRAAPLKTETGVGRSTQNCVKNVQASWGFQVMDWPGSLGDGS